MKRLAVMLSLMVVVGIGLRHGVAGAPANTASSGGESSTPMEAGAAKPGNDPTWESSFEKWADERAGPWMACAILGGWHYLRYLYDKSNWVKLMILSRYLEQSDCFWQNYAWAAAIYREGAKAGREVAALYLGYLYLKGLGVKRDVKEARRWFDLGVLFHIDAEVTLQVLHTELVMDRRGVPRELLHAIVEARIQPLSMLNIEKISQSLRKGQNGMTRNEEAAAELEAVLRRAELREQKMRQTEPKFRNFQEKFQYFRDRLANSVHIRDPLKRKFEIYWSVSTIYDFATLGNHAPSQKIIAGLFEAGELVPKDMFVAYVFYGSAKLNGLDVRKEIERVRKVLTPDQIAEADKDIRERKVSRKYRYRGIRKKLPKDPY